VLLARTDLRLTTTTIVRLAMAFIAFTKVIDFTTLTAEQRRKLKSILGEREKQLKKAIKDVESALSNLERTGRKSQKKKGRR
jgi:antitoxin component of RelBE/YafQ-DinJ toxin-antitoxin module